MEARILNDGAETAGVQEKHVLQWEEQDRAFALLDRGSDLLRLPIAVARERGGPLTTPGTHGFHFQGKG